MKYPPRKGDLPRDELVRRANAAIELHGPDTEVHFKYTCMHCGERCILQEPNMLYENGECATCGKSTPILAGGFMLHIKTGNKKLQ